MRFFSTFLNLLLPSAGLALLGRWRLAFLTQILLIALITLLCWSRLVFEPVWLKTTLALIALIYVISSGGCLKKTQTPAKSIQRIFFTLIFVVICLFGFRQGYLYKHQWLGLHIYFVPSASMMPTIKPGELILIDSWAYVEKTPLLNDVVVFEHGITKQHLVKRVTPWPEYKTPVKGIWFVTGDNSNASQDSRYFGGINSEKIKGKVKMVLFRLNDNKPFNVQLQLTTVN